MFRKQSAAIASSGFATMAVYQLFLYICGYMMHDGDAYAAHVAHAVSAQREITSNIADLPTHRGRHRVQASSTEEVVPEDDDGMKPVKPFLAHNAIVNGPASRFHQDQFRQELRNSPRDLHDYRPASSSSRKLLHGFRNPRRYPRCRTCRAVRCNQTTCTGHCKQRARLFDCTITDAAQGGCVGLSVDEFAAQNNPPAAFPRDQSVVLTAAAPFIGCMISADRPTGCPPAGTPASEDFRDTITIVNSTCLTPPFVPDCNVPFLPFGVCMCEIEITVPGRAPLVRPRPCLTTIWPGWSGEVEPDNEIVVEAQGTTTYTGFSDRRYPGQEDHVSHTVDVGAHFSGFDYPGFEGATVTQDFFITTFSADYFSEDDSAEHDPMDGDYDFIP